MNKTELIEISSYESELKIYNEYIFWEAEIYGTGKIFRQYGNYPKFLPIIGQFQHGVNLWDHIPLRELDNKKKAPLAFYYSKRLCEVFIGVANNKCYPIINPFVLYRRKKKIAQIKQPKGSIFFLSHSTDVIDTTFDRQLLLEELRSLSPIYGPVTICLYYLDVLNGNYEFFLQNGFNVVTFGHSQRKDFVRRFYAEIRKYKYCLSNEIGSYAFYSIELNIPFIYLKNRPIFHNKGDVSFETGTLELLSNFRNKFIELVEKANDSISLELRNLVFEELGIEHSVSRIKFTFLLYYSYLVYLPVLLKRKFLLFVEHNIPKSIRVKLKALFFVRKR